MQTTFAEDYVSIVGTPVIKQRASQEELDQIGLLLDRLEELEIYMDSPNISSKNFDDSQAEIDSINDQMSILLELV